MSHRPDARGQSLVEFALVLPLFLVLVFGVIDGGRAIFAFNQMSQITRSVARAASTACFQTATPCDTTSGPISTAITDASVGLQAPVAWMVTCVNPATGAVPDQKTDFCKVGYLVRVRAEQSFALITPVASSFGPVTVGSSTEQEILQ
jgi:Flp pilus assembly protein TadG